MESPKQMTPNLPVSKNFCSLIISATEKALEISPLSTEFEHQALMITVSNDYKEPISPQRPLSDFSQSTTLFTEVENSLHGPNDSLNDEMEVQEASSSVL